MSVDAATASESRRYGGEHHRLSLIDRLGERVDRVLHDDSLGRDPEFITRMLPVWDFVLPYFAPEVEGFERLPARGPMLIVGNHSGGIYMPDYWVFLRQWVRERGVDEALYSLGLDFMFSLPGVSSVARRCGAVPASQVNAGRLLGQGASVIVYPGGDTEDYRPWTERHRVDLHGHTGFVRLALRHQVPVVPVVAHGSHDAIIVLSRGEALARRLGLGRLRINVMPLVAGPLWPLPAKVTVRVCEPLDWSGYGPDAAANLAVVRRCYEEILGRLQSNLDELVAARPHPVLSRVTGWMRPGSRRPA